MSTEDTKESPKEKKKEIFGIPQDDAALYAAAGALGIAGLVGVKTLLDMLGSGQIPNLFAPRQQRTSYDDYLDQQEYANEYARAQQLEQQKALAQHQQHTQQGQSASEPNGSDFGANSIAASNDTTYQGFDDEDDGVSYSTTVTPPRSASRNTMNYNRINVG